LTRPDHAGSMFRTRAQITRSPDHQDASGHRPAGIERKDPDTMPMRTMIKTGAIIVGVGLLGLITIWLWDDIGWLAFPAIWLAVALAGQFGGYGRKWGSRNW